jgi:hypothetical protein
MTRQQWNGPWCAECDTGVDSTGHGHMVTCSKRKHFAAIPGPLTVWYGSMPESNGKTNFTAILHRGDITAGYTIDRSEYPDRVRYESDRVRWLIGETEKEPCILEYDGDKRSDYIAPAAPAKVEAWMHRTTGALLHEQSKDMCDGRRNSGVWIPLGEVQR